MLTPTKSLLTGASARVHRRRVLHRGIQRQGGGATGGLIGRRRGAPARSCCRSRDRRFPAVRTRRASARSCRRSFPRRSDHGDRNSAWRVLFCAGRRMTTSLFASWWQRMQHSRHEFPHRLVICRRMSYTPRSYAGNGDVRHPPVTGTRTFGAETCPACAARGLAVRRRSAAVLCPACMMPIAPSPDRAPPLAKDCPPMKRILLSSIPCWPATGFAKRSLGSTIARSSARPTPPTKGSTRSTTSTRTS